MATTVRDSQGNPVTTSNGQVVNSGSTPTYPKDKQPSANISVGTKESSVAAPGATQQTDTTAKSANRGSMTQRFPVQPLSIFGAPPWPNDLESYASYTYKFTFAVLTADELNNPDTTYRQGKIKNIILRSSGSRDKAQTFAENVSGGPTEFYIDDVELKSYLTHNKNSKQASLHGFSFKVYEPYSMGEFLETLQVAALSAGYTNYLVAPYLLTLEFLGYRDPGSGVAVPVKSGVATKFLTIKLSECDFQVTEQGSVYNVSGYPFNHSIFTDVIQTIKTDVNIKGRTLIEALQTGAESLSTIINTAAIKAAQSDNSGQPDQYVFLFPKFSSSKEANILGSGFNQNGATTSSNVNEISQKKKQELFESITGRVGDTVPTDFDATLSQLYGIVIRRSNIGETIRAYAEKPENLNEIAIGKIVQTINDSGNVPVAAPNLSQNKDKNGIARAKIQVPDTLRTFQFKTGTKIQSIIEEMILSSEWGRAVQDRLEQPDANNMVDWYKIDGQVYEVVDQKTVSTKGENPKVFVFMVRPYKVHASRFANPAKPQPSTKQLKAQAAKEYNYIYTGKNKDILDFQIKFDAAFYVGLNAGAQSTLGSKAATQQQMVNKEKEATPKLAEGDQGLSSRAGQVTVKQTPNSTTGQQGGGGKANTKTAIARGINDTLVNSPADLVSVELKIWGDPFWISDNGMGNYIASPGGYFNINADGGVDGANGEVDLILNFSTPHDISPDFGYMDFPQGLGGGPVKAFSGLYQVNLVTSNFNGGKFTQNLEMIRRRNQPEDAGATGSKAGNAVVQKGPPAQNINKQDPMADSEWYI